MRRKSAFTWPDIDSGGWELMKRYLFFITISYYAWGGMFSERGYTAVEIDIDAPEQSTSNKESLQVMAKG
jgi:hypothetical protein